MRTLDTKWNDYVTTVLPQNCSAVQLQETKRAFYAGAAGLLGLFFEANDSDLPDEAVSQLVETWHDECVLFSQAVAEGRA